MSLERLKPDRFLLARVSGSTRPTSPGWDPSRSSHRLRLGTFPWSGSTTLTTPPPRDWTWSAFIAPSSWSLEIDKFLLLCAVVVSLSSLARSRRSSPSARLAAAWRRSPIQADPSPRPTCTSPRCLRLRRRRQVHRLHVRRRLLLQPFPATRAAPLRRHDRRAPRPLRSRSP